MKKLNLKLTFVMLLFTVFSFQYATAQLTVINTSACWIVVGEQEGPNCNFCNVAQGTWVAPFGGIAVFQPTCPFNGTVVTPFPPPPLGQQFWIGVKFGVSQFGPGGAIGPGSFSDNPNYPGGPCGFQTLNSGCGTTAIIPQWLPPGPLGQATVVF